MTRKAVFVCLLAVLFLFCPIPMWDGSTLTVLSFARSGLTGGLEVQIWRFDNYPFPYLESRGTKIWIVISLEGGPHTIFRNIVMCFKTRRSKP